MKTAASARVDGLGFGLAQRAFGVVADAVLALGQLEDLRAGAVLELDELAFPVPGDGELIGIGVGGGDRDRGGPGFGDADGELDVDGRSRGHRLMMSWSGDHHRALPVGGGAAARRTRLRRPAATPTRTARTREPAAGRTRRRVLEFLRRSGPGSP